MNDLSEPTTPYVFWFTGLSGAGKSTVANALMEVLDKECKWRCIQLDGDILRTGLCSDLGFSEEDRHENQRRLREVVKLLLKTGTNVVVSFISPFAHDRQIAREMLEDKQFIEIYVNTTLEQCEQRDPKGLYQKARAGQIKEFTGIDSPFEVPANPEIEISGAGTTPDQSVSKILTYLKELEA
ncbi:Adenylyl-sulfate kinase [Thalassocella blandensis]|nr:Adenylyl-sulfate kinase [Thalassocella blandensis]